MVPTSWLTVLAFFAFVAPGVFYDLLHAGKFADRRETIFREVGRVVLVSTWCSAAALLVVTGLIWVARLSGAGRDFLPVAREMILADKAYVADHTSGLATVSGVFVLCSLGISWLTFAVVYRGDKGKITRRSTWTKAFRVDAPIGSYPLVRVRLQSGTSWVGRVADFSADLELADRELVLSPPLAIKVDGVNRSIQGTGRVILRGEQIESIE